MSKLIEYYFIRFMFDEYVNLIGVFLGNIISLLLAVFKVIFGDEFVFLLFFGEILVISKRGRENAALLFILSIIPITPIVFP
ncbi:MAG: hypothetical protein RQ760_17205, partial [Sedimentisphaerales bacterium]|nr:hypothetical protein [Sedimentisphaerales bacterium]